MQKQQTSLPEGTVREERGGGVTNLLVRLFVPGSEDVGNAYVRGRYGKLAGIVGIASNLLLFALKLAAGLLTGSIAIMADAVNNLADCTSSIVTLLGFKLSGMPADEQHPYGHARYEYISGLVVSFFVLAIGFQFLLSSIQKIRSPEVVLFTPAAMVVLIVSIAVKLWQGMFNKNIGVRIDSFPLKATATDSLNDVFITTAVLIGAVVAQWTGWQLDGFMGVLVAAFILYSGVQLVIETLNPLIGMAPDKEMIQQIQQKILGYPTVMGLHDLIVHNYGPGCCFASVHVEVPAEQDILVSHDIIDNIEKDFALEMGIQMVIHLDPIVTDDQQLSRYRDEVDAMVRSIDPQLSTHDFRMVEGKTHTNFIFDIVVPPKFRLTDSALRDEVNQRVQAQTPHHHCIITLDRNYISTRPEPGEDNE